MADSYDDFLADDGQGGTATSDDSYAEFKRQQRADSLNAERAKRRQPPVAPVSAPAPLTPGGALNLTPYTPDVAPTVGRGVQAVGQRMVLAPADVTRTRLTPAAEPDPFASGEGIEARLGREAHEGSISGMVGSFAEEQAAGALGMVVHPVDAAAGLAKRVVTAPLDIVRGVGNIGARSLTQTAEAMGVSLPQSSEGTPSYGESAGQVGGGLLDTALLTEPVIGGASKIADAGSRAAYRAAGEEQRFQSALARAQSDAMAARARRAGAEADAQPAAPRGMPETNPSRLLPAGQYNMPPAQWESSLFATKADAAAASEARAAAKRAQPVEPPELVGGEPRAPEPVSGVNTPAEPVVGAQVSEPVTPEPLAVESGSPTALPKRAGFTAAGPLAMTVAGGAGALIGGTKGDTPEERLQNAAAGAIGALGLVAIGTRLARDGGAARLERVDDAAIRGVDRPTPQPPSRPGAVADIMARGQPIDMSEFEASDADMAAARRRTGAIGEQPKEPAKDWKQVRAEALGEDAFPHKFASTQLNLPDETAAKVKALGAKIPDEDLAADGRETQPHVTVKFGLHGNDPEAVRALLADEKPITVKMGKTSHFKGVEGGTADAVKVDVDSPELHALNAKIADAVPNTDTYPEYVPHATVAYVKPGLGEKYSGSDALEGHEVTVDHVTFSGRDGKQIDIPLGGKEVADEAGGAGPRTGAADPRLVKTLGLAGVGALAGGTQGATPEERERNAALGFVLGGAGGAMLSRGARAVEGESFGARRAAWEGERDIAATRAEDTRAALSDALAKSSLDDRAQERVLSTVGKSGPGSLKTRGTLLGKLNSPEVSKAFGDAHQAQLEAERVASAPPVWEPPVTPPKRGALSSGEKAEIGAEASGARETPSVSKAADAIRSTFAPQTRSPEAAQTAQSIRASVGQVKREAAIAQTTLDRVGADVQKLPIGKQLGFIDRIEAGVSQKTERAAAGKGDVPKADLGAHQPIANSIRRTLDEERDAIIETTGKLTKFNEDYFPHLWQDPEAAKNWLAQIMGKKPFEGSKAFLKKRTIPTVLDGMFPEGVPKNLESMSNAEIIAENKRQGGLVPVTFNPVEATMLKLREMKKFRSAQEVIKDLDTRGLLKAGPGEGERMPVGYARIGDWAFTNKIAPEPVARVLNNYFSPGIHGTPLSAAYDAYMAVGNTLNRAQLGLSAFHAGMTTIEAMVSHNALSLEKLFQGKPGEALKRFVTSGAGILAPFENVKRGSELLKAYHQPPGTLSGPIKAIADAAAEAGSEPHMEGFDRASKAFANAREAKQYGRMAKQFLPALLEKSTGRVMNDLVPRQKYGVFYDLMQSELEKLGPQASADAVTQAAQKAWDSVDNRLGSLVYDNLFWDKTAKDVLHASVRSVGWNWGTFRELGGGTKDLAGMMKDIVTGKSPELSHRAAYTLALPMTVGVLGAITQYLYTGKGPETLQDYFQPRTGTKDADGNDNRVQLPTYMKDVLSYGTHPAKTLTNKLNPLIGMLYDTWTNKNFYGDEIRNPGDPFLKELGQTAKYVGKESIPFFLQNIVEGKKRGASPSEEALSFVGITPASREAVRSKAQNMMADYYAKTRPSLSPEDAAAAQVRAELRAKVKKHGPQAAMAELKQRVAAGEITQKQVQNILADDQTPGIVKRFKGLPLKDAEKIYAAGTAREKQLWAPVLTTKRENANR